MPKNRTLAVAWRIITQIRRDHRTVGLIFIVPVVIIGLLGYIMRLPSTTLVLGVANQDQGISAPIGTTVHFGEALVDSLRESEDLTIVEVSPGDAENKVEEGSLDGAILLPEDFTSRLVEEGSLEFTLLLEGSDPGENARVQGILGAELVSSLHSLAEAQGEAPPVTLDMETQYLYAGEEFDVLDFFAPIFIAFFAFFLVFLLTGVSFLRERAGGTLERLMASPVTRLEVVLGYMLGFGLFALIQSTVILLFVIFVLRIHYVGNPLLIFLVEVLLTIGAVNMGIFLSTFARTELQVIQFIPLVIVPQGLLSGILVPVEDLPDILRWVAYLMPMTYANQALQEVMLKGFTASQILSELVALGSFALLMIILAALTLRREIV